MKTLDINLMFWTDNLPESTRERNVNYAISELKNLISFLSNHINCQYKVLDYSPNQIIKDSIHIPYPPSVYKRSEKINNVLKDCNSDWFSIIDSDCFICREDYSKLANLLVETPTNSCFTFDVLDINHIDTPKVINGADPLNFEPTSRFPGRAGMLGAFFITNTQNLKNIGGFNTKFTTWGGEDGEVYDKIYYEGSIQKLPINNQTIRLFHLSHECERNNINYFNREEYIKNNF